MKTDLSGQIALVTGGANGIGLAIGQAFAANGAHVIVADIDGAQADRAAAMLPLGFGLAMDVSDGEQVDRTVANVVDRFGRIDVVVNNAGIAPRSNRVGVDTYPPDEWRRVMSIDLDGVFLVSRAAGHAMTARGSGRIINIASTAGIAALRLQSAYVAAKAGVIQLTRAMALELGQHGILVNAIAPGSVVTDITRKLFYGEDGSFKDQAHGFLKHIPLGRPGTPEEIAQAALFLAAPEVRYVTGHVLVVDGGWTAGYMI